MAYVFLAFVAIPATVGSWLVVMVTEGTCVTSVRCLPLIERCLRGRGGGGGE